MRLYHVRVAPGSGDPMPARTWLIIARSEYEARKLAPLPSETAATIEAVRELPADNNRQQGVIGWMGESPGAAF